jgi:hypothetical protein
MDSGFVDQLTESGTQCDIAIVVAAVLSFNDLEFFVARFADELAAEVAIQNARPAISQQDWLRRRE